MSKKSYVSPDIKLTEFDNSMIITASGVLNDKGEIVLPMVPASKE